MEKQLLRVGEAARALNVSRWTIYRWVKDGRLESARIGQGSLRIVRASIMALIERGRTVSVDLIRKDPGSCARDVVGAVRRR
jgi:excisionase family DNA binding protein